MTARHAHHDTQSTKPRSGFERHARTMCARNRLDEIATQAVADAAPFAVQRHIDLGLPEAEAVTVSGQPDALRVLMRNLIDNAIKYTPEGGTVDVRVQAQGTDALLIVDDSGPGIPEDQRADAMRRFHRAAQEGAAQVPGSGLGLAIVETIARAHGASVSLETAPGLGGLRVVVRMPCRHGESTETTA